MVSAQNLREPNSDRQSLPFGYFQPSKVFSATRQSQQMTNTQNTARHSTTESKLHSTRIIALLIKTLFWLDNYNALDVVDDNCYTSL